MFNTVISYDLETTGFSVRSDEILEIGAIKYNVDTNQFIEFSTLIKPKNGIGWQITLVTGIDQTTLNLEGALDLQEALFLFHNFCFKETGKVLFVGHDVRRFDNPFINTRFKRYNFSQISDRLTWDTLLQTRADMSRKRKSTFYHTQQEAKGYRVKKKTNLIDACKYYSVKLETPRHRALPDAKNAFNLFVKQIKKNRWAIVPYNRL